MALASSDLLCSCRILNALLFLSAIYITDSYRVTHGQLFCKEISDVNIRTWVARAKKVAVSGGLSTVWGFCRLGGRYFKNWRMLYSVFAKSAGLPDKTGIFSFCPAKFFSLSDKCPVNLSKENNILTTNMPSVLQILNLSCKRLQSV